LQLIDSAIPYIIKQLGNNELFKISYSTGTRFFPSRTISESASHILSLAPNKYSKYLINALSSTSPQVREKSIYLLSKFHNTSALPYIEKLLADNNNAVVQATLYYIMNLNVFNTINPILFKLNYSNSKNQHLNWYIISPLGYFKDPRAVEPLILCLKSSYSKIIIKAINSLTLINDTRAIKYIKPFVESKNSDIKRSALNAIKKIGKDTIIIPFDGIRQGRNWKNILSNIPEEKEFHKNENIIKKRHCSIYNDTFLLKEQVENLHSKSYSKKKKAILALRELDNPKAIEPLTHTAINDTSINIKIAAISTIANYHIPATTKAFIKILNTIIETENHHLLYHVLSTYRKTDNQYVINAFKHFIDIKDSNARKDIYICLLNNKPNNKLILSALNDDNADIRTLGLNSITEKSDEYVLNKAKTLLKDSNDKVKWTAFSRLTKVPLKFTSKDILEFIHQSISNNCLYLIGSAFNNIKDRKIILKILNDTTIDDRIRNAAYNQIVTAFGINTDSNITKMAFNYDKYFKTEHRSNPFFFRRVLTDPNIEVSNYLISKLKENNLTAIKICGHTKKKIFIPYLLSLTNSKNDSVRTSAIGTIGSISSINSASTLNNLILSLSTKDTKIKNTFFNILSNIKDNKSIQNIVELTNSDNKQIKFSALNICLHLPANKYKHTILKNILSTDDYKLIKQLIAYPKDNYIIGIDLIPLLYYQLIDSNDIYITKALDRSINYINSNRYTENIFNLNKKTRDYIYYVNPKMLSHNVIKKGLDSKNKSILWASIYEAGLVKDKEVLDNLHSILLKNEDWQLREIAAYSIGHIHNIHSFKSLSKALYDKNYFVRIATVKSIFKINEDKTIETLKGMLRSWRLTHKIYAIEELSYLKSPNVFKIIDQELDNPNSLIKLASIIAILNLNETRSVPNLIKLINDRNFNVRKTAVYTLGYLGDTSATMPLINLINKENSDIKTTAVEALGKLKDKRAVETLINILYFCKSSQTRHLYNNKNINIAAIRALGNIGDTSAIDAISSNPFLKKHYHLKYEARIALEKLNTK
jgi:HEAT repeat protein